MLKRNSHEGHTSMMASKNTTSPTRVLIAEDNSKTRLFLKSQLELLGFDVVAAVSNGKDAVKLASEIKPDLVIMDVKMP